LGKELILYRSFFNAQQLSEEKSFKLLEVITSQRTRLNEASLSMQKYNLIKEIKNHYDIKEFLNGRIPSYKVYASIYKVFDGAINEIEDYTEIDGFMSAKFTIVEHLSGKLAIKEANNETELFETVRNQEEDLRLLSYRILIERFNDKYANLNDRQKNLLREYIYNVSNTVQLRKYAVQEADSLITELQTKLRMVENKITRIKLVEIVSQLEKIRNLQVIKENHMTALLIALEITKTLDTLQS
jgi:ABC-type antimicrobial peptide transport system permease subunit